MIALKKTKIAAMIMVIMTFSNIFFILEPPFIDTLEVKVQLFLLVLVLQQNEVLEFYFSDY